MICGEHKQTFNIATHCLFSGCLDNPYFRSVTIQRIIEHNRDFIVLDKSGRAEIKRKKGREYVVITYSTLDSTCKAVGYPFKDNSKEKGGGA